MQTDRQKQKKCIKLQQQNNFFAQRELLMSEKNKNCSSCREKKTLKLMVCFPPIHPSAIFDFGFEDSSKKFLSQIRCAISQ
jgi:hypothetical protein